MAVHSSVGYAINSPLPAAALLDVFGDAKSDIVFHSLSRRISSELVRRLLPLPHPHIESASDSRAHVHLGDEGLTKLNGGEIPST